jgi:hypothetical protein
MAQIILESPSGDLVVPEAALREAGVEPGRLVEIVPLPGTREITFRALGQCVRKLGDAIGVSEPEWDAAAREWRVELRLSTTDELLGHLFYDAHGQLIEDKSATYESVRKTGNAPRAEDPAA